MLVALMSTNLEAQFWDNISLSWWLIEQTQQVGRVTRYGVPRLANPFKLTCALPATSQSSFVLTWTLGTRSPCGHSRRLLTHYHPREVRNSIQWKPDISRSCISRNWIYRGRMLDPIFLPTDFANFADVAPKSAIFFAKSR